MPHDQIPSERPATLQSIVRSILFLQLWHLVGSWCTVPSFARQTTRNIPMCHLMKSGSRTGGGPRPYQTFSIFRCRENVSIIYHLEHYRRRRVNVGHELVGLPVTFIVYYGEARKVLRVPVRFLYTFYFLPWRLAIYCPVVLLAASVAYEPGTWALSELLREVSNGFIGAFIISCETLLAKSRLDISLRMLRH